MEQTRISVWIVLEKTIVKDIPDNELYRQLPRAYMTVIGMELTGTLSWELW